ncbi:MAG: hypothetical protein KF784_15855 [Fimbriimonadaceae bacterium]|nr:hypothetical protein [Fimbriimonadaceae bacterium]
MPELKRISTESIPRALALAERYRLLSEPAQAASICRDVLAVDPNNVEAQHSLFLAITDQFHLRHGTKVEDANVVVEQMGSEYEKAYYGGIACERWARAKLQEGAHASFVGDWLKRAMEKYALAESLRPPGNENAILRWNACVRLTSKIPGLMVDREDTPHFGD